MATHTYRTYREAKDKADELREKGFKCTIGEVKYGHSDFSYRVYSYRK